MAQVLKEEKRHQILRAALDEFYQHGYRNASMRNIAAAAGVPASLIYSYYKSKAALFDAVVAPVRYDWQHVLSAGGRNLTTHAGSKFYGLSPAETKCLLSLFDHRKEFIILMDRSEGTKYASEKENFIQQISAHLMEHCEDATVDDVFVYVIASGFVQGLMEVIYHYKGKEWATMTLDRLSKMYLSGIGM